MAFWFAIIGTTTFGAEISDMIDRTLKAGYLFGSIILLSGLLTMFAYCFIRKKPSKWNKF